MPGWRSFGLHPGTTWSMSTRRGKNQCRDPRLAKAFQPPCRLRSRSVLALVSHVSCLRISRSYTRGETDRIASRSGKDPCQASLTAKTRNRQGCRRSRLTLTGSVSRGGIPSAKDPRLRPSPRYRVEAGNLRERGISFPTLFSLGKASPFPSPSFSPSPCTKSREDRKMEH